MANDDGNLIYGTGGSVSGLGDGIEVAAWKGRRIYEKYVTDRFGGGNWHTSVKGLCKIIGSAVGFVHLGGDWNTTDQNGAPNIDSQQITLRGASDGSMGYDFSGNVFDMDVDRVEDGIMTVVFNFESTGAVTEI